MKIIIIKTKIIAGAFVLFTLCLFLLLTRTSTFHPHKLYEVGIFVPFIIYSHFRDEEGEHSDIM